MAVDQLYADDFRNLREGMLVLQSIYVFSANFQALLFDFLSHLVLFLLLRVPQPYAFNTDLFVGPLSGQVAMKLIPELTKPREDLSSTNKDLVKKRKADRWSRFEASRTEPC